MTADNEIELAAARAPLWQVSWQVAGGDKSTEASPRAKVFISEAVRMSIAKRAARRARANG